MTATVSWRKKVASRIADALFDRRQRLKRTYLTRVAGELVGVDQRLKCFVDGSGEFAVARNNSRMAIAVTETPVDGSYLVLKSGTDVASRRELDVETACLSQIRSDLLGSGFLAYLPERIVAQPDGPLPFIVYASPSRYTALDVARAGGLDEDLITDALDTVRRLKEETSVIATADPSLIERTVGRRVDVIREQWGGAFFWREDQSRLNVLRRELVASLEGCRVEQGWQHGDFSLGNVLIDPVRRRVAGIIDWGGSASDEIVGVDPSLFALSVFAFRTSTDVNASVARLVKVLASPTERSEDERRVIERMKEAWPTTQDLTLMQGLVVTWLYHVAHLFKIRSPNVLAPGHWVQRESSRALRAVVEWGIPNLRAGFRS